MALDVLEKAQMEAIVDRLKTIYPNELDENMIATLKQRIAEGDEKLSTLARQIYDLYKPDKDKLEGLLTRYQIPLKNQQQVTQQTTEEVKYALNLQDVTDFTRDGKTYIKITYQDGRVQMIESRNGKDTKQVFEDVQKLKAINNINGKKNAEETFKELLKDYVEIPFENTTFINQEKLNNEEQSRLGFVEMQFPGRQVLAVPEKNMYIIKGNGIPDITVEVVLKDGEYKLNQIEESSYGVKQEKIGLNEEPQTNVMAASTQIEVPTAVTGVQNLNSDAQVGTVRIDPVYQDMLERPNEFKDSHEVEQLLLETEGMSEEEIVQYLRIHGKNPQQIMMIMLALDEKKAEKNKQVADPTLQKPKQMVLVNPNLKGKMAGFVDALTLAFFIGVLCGTGFFIMLRLFLQHLG